jgi:hypothetical protein
MFVFLNAENKSIVVSIDQTPVGRADNAAELAEIFTLNNITTETDIFCSSSIDFAAEAGFDSDSDAHNMIDKACVLLYTNETL